MQLYILSLFFLNRDGSAGIFRDYAIPSGQFPPFGNRSSSREAVPAAGFMWVNFFHSLIFLVITNPNTMVFLSASKLPSSMTEAGWPSTWLTLKLKVALKLLLQMPKQYSIGLLLLFQSSCKLHRLLISQLTFLPMELDCKYLYYF